jgi:16S rRNA processing protein RimM
LKSSNDPHDPPDCLLIAKIIGVQGLRGDVKIFSHAESCATFAPGRNLLIRAPDGLETIYVVNGSRPHKRLLLLSLKGIENRDQAEKIVGSDVFLFKADLPDLEEDANYWFEIIGLDVYTLENCHLGRVSSIFSTGSNDVYVVQSPEKGQEILIPALRQVVREIDLDRKTMRVDLPEGLI